MTVKQMRLERWVLGVLLIGLCGASVSQAAVQARLSQDQAYIGDPLTLTLSSDAAGNGVQPDLSPLQRDFQVLGSGTSSQLSIINGRRSARTDWQVQLLPRRSGELTIPPVQIGAERSKPLTLKVTDTPPPTAATTAQHLFIEATVAPAVRDPYVQQQVPYTVRLYYDNSLLDGELIEPQVANAVIERLGEDLRYTATRNGRQYRVLERRYAFFPQQSGTLEIPPLRFEGRMRGQKGGSGLQSRAGGLMQRLLQNSPFANDPFFRGGGFANDPFAGVFGEPGQTVRVFAPALQVTVRPRPIGQGVWLPARAVRLHDSWTDDPPSSLQVGEPVSRIVTVEAEGLGGAQIPALELPAPVQLRTYREPLEHATQYDGERLVGVSRQTLTYIPNAAGALEIPPVELAWWNTAKDEAAEVALPAWQFTVQAGAGGQTTQAPPAMAPAADSRSSSADTRSAAKPTAGESATLRNWREVLLDHWVWLVAGLAAVFAVLAGLSSLRRRRAGPAAAAVPAATVTVPPSPVNALDRAAELRTLEAACRSRDGVAAAKSLLALAASQWPEAPPLNLSALASRLGAGADVVGALDRHLYGVGGDWQPERLWDAVKEGLAERRAPPAPETANDLPPLYSRRA